MPFEIARYTIVDAMTDAQRTAIITNQDAAYQANGLGVNDRDLTYFSLVNFRNLTAWPMFRDNGLTCAAFFFPNGTVPYLLLGDTFPFADPMMVRGINAERVELVSDSAKDSLLAQTVANKGFLELAFHNDLTSLPAWIARIQAAGLTVTTYERLRRQYRHA